MFIEGEVRFEVYFNTECFKGDNLLLLFLWIKFLLHHFWSVLLECYLLPREPSLEELGKAWAGCNR